MKKMMTLAACLLIAAVTQAAAVGWTLTNATAFKNGGYDVFVIGINGVTSVDQITAILKGSGGIDGLADYAWASGTVNVAGIASKTSTASGKTITYSGSGTDSYTAFAVLWDKDKANASWTGTTSISMDNDATSKTLTFGNQSAALTANKFALGGGTTPSEPIPEPTSGLLLVVGGALLALRRRQK